MLHTEGRNHIWAYYTRNLVRPVALRRSKVDVVIGNPPWLNYNQTIGTLRTELERQSRDDYGIWAGGRYASNQDVAGLFYARSVDLYLKDEGVIGMVMPHSALQAGQHSKWRTGEWKARAAGRGRNSVPGRTLSVDFSYKTAWDLEGLEPNTFFPIPASVVFARRTGENAAGKPLAGEVERWLGKEGAPDVERVSAGITDTSRGRNSPYAAHSRQGAAIRPRRLFFVEKTENTAIVQAGQTVTVNPRRGSQDKEPWRSLDLTVISDQTIEASHVYDVHHGETVAPYATLIPLKAVLPLKRGDTRIPTAPDGPGGVSLGGLERRMRDRWQTVSRLWDENKARANELDLLGRLDYHRELSAQLDWKRNPGDRPIRVVYTAAGEPTATILTENDSLVDERLYWITCKDIQEAYYLLAIINSKALHEAAAPFMSKGQFGARDLHKHLWKPAHPCVRIAAMRLHVAQYPTPAGPPQRARRGSLQSCAWSGNNLTVTIARRELRQWLRGSPARAGRWRPTSRSSWARSVDARPPPAQWRSAGRPIHVE